MRALTLALVGAAVMAIAFGISFAQAADAGECQKAPDAKAACGSCTAPKAACTSCPAAPQCEPKGPPGGPMAGFHILPRMLAEKLNLTDDQKTQIAELEKETKAKLDKILTVDQQKMLDEFRPMHRGMGGPGMGGPGMEGGHEGHDGPGAPGEGGQTPPPPAN